MYLLVDVSADTDGPLLFTCFSGHQMCSLEWVIMAWFQEGAYGTVWYKVDFPQNPLHGHSVHTVAYQKGPAMEYSYIYIYIFFF